MRLSTYSVSGYSGFFVDVEAHNGRCTRAPLAASCLHRSVPLRCVNSSYASCALRDRGFASQREGVVGADRFEAAVDLRVDAADEERRDAGDLRDVTARCVEPFQAAHVGVDEPADPPGDVSPPHHHAGFVFVYVLAGTVESKLNDEPSKRFAVGETWVEPPGTLHASMSNPSKTEPARILAVFVAPDGAQLTTMKQ